MSEEDDFGNLPPRLQRQIDAVFNKLTRKNGKGNGLITTESDNRPSKRRKVDDATITPGGFLVDDEEPQVSGGGFIIEEDREDEDASSSSNAFIPLSLIPSAVSSFCSFRSFRLHSSPI